MVKRINRTLFLGFGLCIAPVLQASLVGESPTRTYANGAVVRPEDEEKAFGSLKGATIKDIEKGLAHSPLRGKVVFNYRTGSLGRSLPIIENPCLPGGMAWSVGSDTHDDGTVTVNRCHLEVNTRHVWGSKSLKALAAHEEGHLVHLDHFHNLFLKQSVSVPRALGVGATAAGGVAALCLLGRVSAGRSVALAGLMGMLGVSGPYAKSHVDYARMRRAQEERADKYMLEQDTCRSEIVSGAVEQTTYDMVTRKTQQARHGGIVRLYNQMQERWFSSHGTDVERLKRIMGSKVAQRLSREQKKALVKGVLTQVSAERFAKEYGISEAAVREVLALVRSECLQVID